MKWLNYSENRVKRFFGFGYISIKHRRAASVINTHHVIKKECYYIGQAHGREEGKKKESQKFNWSRNPVIGRNRNRQFKSIQSDLGKRCFSRDNNNKPYRSRSSLFLLLLFIHEGNLLYNRVIFITWSVP